MTIDKIFDMLFASGESVRGEEIAEKLGITRTAVNKHIKKLQADGINIETSRKGYRYLPSDTLTEITLAKKLQEKGVDIDVIVKEVESTNVSAKQLVTETNGIGDFVFIAPKQGKGKGRISREFVSNEGGIYMTLCYKPTNLAVTDSLKIVLLTGLCVARILNKYVDNVSIKWPNDVFVNDKKICGILLESIISEYTVDKLILGIGINVSNDIPANLEHIATSLARQGVSAYREDIIIELITMLYEELARYSKEGFAPFLDEYLAMSRTIGRDVVLNGMNGKTTGRAVGLSDEGYLLLEHDGVVEKVIVGDIEV